MLIVSGHLVLDPADRDAHVIASAGAVHLARQSPGCLDFAVSADPVDPTRVNVFERWARPADLDAFRASADPDDERVDFSRIRRFEVKQYSAGERFGDGRIARHLDGVTPFGPIAELSSTPGIGIVARLRWGR